MSSQLRQLAGPGCARSDVKTMKPSFAPSWLAPGAALESSGTITNGQSSNRRREVFVNLMYRLLFRVSTNAPRPRRKAGRASRLSSGDGDDGPVAVAVGIVVA